MSLPADVLQRMLLFVNPRVGQSVDRVYELADALRRDQRGRRAPADRDLARRRAGGRTEPRPARSHRPGARPPTTHGARCPMSRAARRTPEQARVQISATDDGRRADRSDAIALERCHRHPSSLGCCPPSPLTRRSDRGNGGRRDPRPRRSRRRDRSAARASSRSSIFASGAGCPAMHALNSRPGRASSNAALRRRTEQLRGAVETVQLDENRAGLLGAASPHRRKGAFQMAAADIGRDPDCRFEAHGALQDLSCTDVSGFLLLKRILLEVRRGRRPRFALCAGIARGLSSIVKP